MFFESMSISFCHEEVIEKYSEWILKNPRLLGKLHKIRGKVFGCKRNVLADLTNKGAPNVRESS
jgi:hypothetical protein